MKLYQQLLLVLAASSLVALTSLRFQSSSLQSWWTELASHEDNQAPSVLTGTPGSSTGNHSEVSAPLLLPRNRTHHSVDKAEDLSVCFLTSVYAKWAKHADRLQNVSNLPFYNDSSFSFFAFTNLPRIRDHGWTKLVRQYLEYNRFITQSRVPKFLGWQEPAIKQTCHVVFYMDSIGQIIGTREGFLEQAWQIWSSEVGLAQYLHKGGGGSFGEFRRIEVFHKDLDENIQASKQWLLAQPDFRHNCTLYENRYFGYSLHSTAFRQAAQFLWDHYSQEKDSWRDQPLWCYVLDHFNTTPIPLDHKSLFKLSTRRMGRHGHRYGAETNENARAALLDKQAKSNPARS